MNTRQKGSLAEAAAVRYLIRLGHSVVETNYYIRGGEIDLVTKDGTQLVFIEVKSIQDRYANDIMGLISSRKLKALERTINYWLKGHKLQNADWRFDYIAVVTTAAGKVLDLVHLPNVEL